MSFSLKDFYFPFASDSFICALIPLDVLKENTLPLSSSVLLMVKRGSDADVLHKCLEIKMLTLLTDGESMGLCTGANKAFSTAPCHPVLQHLGKYPLMGF